MKPLTDEQARILIAADEGARGSRVPLADGRPGLLPGPPLDGAEHIAEPSPVFEGYMEGRLEIHCHAGIRLGDSSLDVHQFCILLHRRSDGRTLVADKLAIGETQTALDVEECARNDGKGSVLVVVGKVSEGRENAVGGLPSNVFVSRLDVVSNDPRDPRKPDSNLALKRFGLGIDRELDELSGSFIHRARRRLAVSYELPSNVVEDAPDRVTEPRSERLGQIGPTSCHDDLAAEHLPNVGGLITVWLDLKGWLGMTIEEPAGLAASYTGMEIRPLEFEPRTCKRVSHREVSP